MKRQDKANRIAEILCELYPQPPIPLEHKDPYTLLIAVLLSAQCKDERVNKITPLLFAEADNPADMAQLPVATIEQIIRPCGLSPAKSKNISGLSHKLLADHDGVVPDNFEDLEALPGVGHKTASVVMAQAFGHPAFPVDTHIHRSAARWGLSKARNVNEVERDLKKLFPEDTWHDVHLQIIYFGREHCPARSHDLSQCPICGWAATKARIAEEAKKLPKARRRG